MKLFGKKIVAIVKSMKASQKRTRIHVNIPESKSIVKVVEPSVGEGNPSRSWSHAASRATLLHPDPAFKWPIGFLLLSDCSQPVTWDYNNRRPCQRVFNYVARKSFSNPNNIAPMAPYQP